MREKIDAIDRRGKREGRSKSERAGVRGSEVIKETCHGTDKGAYQRRSYLIERGHE